MRLDGRAAKWAGKTVAEVLELDLKDDAAKRQVKAIVEAMIDKVYLASRKGKDGQRRVREFVVSTDKELEF